MAKGRDDWFVGLFERYSRSLRRYVRRFSVTDETAADVAQEAFLRVYAASKDSSIRHPRALLYQVAHNLVLNYLRSRSRAGLEVADSYDDLGVYADFPSLEEACISRQEYEVVAEAIARLPEQCRRVFILRKVHQYSYKEIAEELAIAVSTVEKHVALGTRLCHAYLGQCARPGVQDPMDGVVSTMKVERRG